jgi:hypothetical protein
MVPPVHVVFTLPSRHAADLGLALKDLRIALTLLRRRACFASVRAAVGAIEPERKESFWFLLRERGDYKL